MTATRGRLGGYALWQLRDYAMGPLVATALLVVVISVFPMWMIAHVARGAGASPADVGRQIPQLFDTMIGFIATLGPIIGVAGMVSSDRQPGLSRFLFSKPVSVSAYYLQAWLVRGAGLLLLTLAATLFVNQAIAPVAWKEAVAVVAICWVLIGGLGLLISVLVSRDPTALFIVYLIPTVLESIRTGVPRWTWVKPVLTVLPPTHRLDDLRRSILAHAPLDQGDFWHVIVFGAASVALAAYLVRRLPLVR